MALKGSCDAKMRHHMNPRLKFNITYINIYVYVLLYTVS